MSDGSEPQWPPDAGWHFRTGEAAFLFVRFAIKGKRATLLESLANAGDEGVTAKQLRVDIWGFTGRAKKDPALQTLVKDVRGRLHKVFGPPLRGIVDLRHVDVIECLDRGAGHRRYRLNPLWDRMFRQLDSPER